MSTRRESYRLSLSISRCTTNDTSNWLQQKWCLMLWLYLLRSRNKRLLATSCSIVALIRVVIRHWKRWLACLRTVVVNRCREDSANGRVRHRNRSKFASKDTKLRYYIVRLAWRASIGRYGCRKCQLKIWRVKVKMRLYRWYGV